MNETPGGCLRQDDPGAMWNQKPPGFPALRYDEDWARSLHRLLRSRLPEAAPIELLDCCCGAGNPTLGLHLLHPGDYAIGWSDGDAAMLRHFHANARHHGLAVEGHEVPWERLREHYGEARFDAVLCIGNSLIYADSWSGRPFDAARSRAAVDVTLAQFHGVLRSGGILLVDTTAAEELVHDQAQWGQGGWREQEEGEYIVTRDYVTMVDRSRSLRRVVNYRHRYHRDSGAYVDTARCEFNGLALSHDALMDAMRGAGFREVAPVEGDAFPWPLFAGTKL